MKLKREIENGILTFLGIGVYFLAMEVLGLANIHYLRVLNIFIVLFFTNRTIKANIKEGKTVYIRNVVSGGLTAFIGTTLSVFALRLYIGQ